MSNLTTYNLGARGWTSRDVLARWHRRVRHAAPARKRLPGGRLFWRQRFGLRDEQSTSRPSRLGQQPGRSSSEECAAAGRGAFVMGPTPTTDPEHHRRIGALDEAYRELCWDASVGFAGVFEGLSESVIWTSVLERGDGAHPGRAGYRQLADLVWPQWIKWICAAKRRNCIRSHGASPAPRGGHARSGSGPPATTAVPPTSPFARRIDVCRITDPAEVLCVASEFLREDPFEHNLILSLLKRRAEDGTAGRYWVARDDADVVAVALQSPLESTVMATFMTQADSRAVREAILEAGVRVEGVMAEAATAGDNNTLELCWELPGHGSILPGRTALAKVMSSKPTADPSASMD
jgi:acyl-CoA thioesterase-1